MEKLIAGLCCIMLFISSWADLGSRTTAMNFSPFGLLLGLPTDDTFLLFQTAIPMTYHKTRTTVVT